MSHAFAVAIHCIYHWMKSVAIIDALFEELESSKFRQPENFDTVKEGDGWVVSGGGNDWEAGITAMAMTMAPVKWGGSRPEAKRIWVHLNMDAHGGGSVDQEKEAVAAAKALGSSAVKTWIKVANRIKREKTKERMPKKWWDAFRDALRDEEMAPMVKEWGRDKTEWAVNDAGDHGDPERVTEKLGPPPDLPPSRAPLSDFSDLTRRSLAYDYVEQEVGRRDWRANWKQIMAKNGKGGLKGKIQRWLDNYEIDHDPEGLVDYIDGMVEKNPGRWL